MLLRILRTKFTWVMWDSTDNLLYPLKTPPPPSTPEVLEILIRHDHSIILRVGL